MREVWKRAENIGPGDILRVKRKAGYYHFGIAISKDEVIHFAGSQSDDVTNSANIKIRRAPMSIFQKNDIVEQHDTWDSPFTRNEVLSRAKEFVDSSTFRDKPYDFLLNNCEHFARYCYSGNPTSDQVRKGIEAVALTAALTGLGIGKLFGKTKENDDSRIIDLTNNDEEK